MPLAKSDQPTAIREWTPWSGISRRAALLGACAVATLSARPGLVRAAMGPNDKFDLLIKGAEVLDPSQTSRQARYRHPLRADRSDGGGHSGGASEQNAHRDRQARGAGPHRPARARLPVRFGHRYPRRRAGAVPGDDNARVGGRRGRQQHSPPSAASLSPATRARLYAFVHIANHRPRRLPGSRTLQHRLRASGCGGQSDGRERRHRHRCQGAHERERHRQARPRAAEARHHGLRASRERAQRSCATSAGSRRRS